ncbi:antibiotic biosynthesis monooxygenase [Marinifilum breve]|uniref:Antibiotic biosynthesis monooxygenase n=1 Tax=Marinifilum breve TaxID=2184082 RepID=A0A2V3ZUK7_9BACT|nr:antibiotic biosynthesis monooxygenase [Marinifilum breve]PXX98760.1 antibiotic biosynthesis monooxygenase [Marinifilum breve]
MIIRFVKLEIQKEHIEDFKILTKNEKADILAFEGCSHLQVLQDQNNPSIFFTVSHWESESALNIYRESDFFRGNWSQVKQWFANKPEAWSLGKSDNS